MSYADGATVFLFMVTLIGGAVYGAAVFASWQNQETRAEIEKKFLEFRKQIKELA